MDELEDVTTIFKPQRKATTNVASGSASEDGDYKALNERRLIRSNDRQSFDLPIIEEAEQISERVPSGIRRTSLLEVQNEEVRRTLFTAVASGNIPKVSQAFTALPPSIKVSDDGFRELVTDKNILHIALENDQMEMAKYIIEKCDEKLLTQKYRVDNNFKTALHDITENNYIDLAIALLDRLHTKKSKINAIKAETTVEVKGQRPRSLSSFHLAAFKGFTGLVRLYVDTGIDINFRNSKRDTALLWASRWGHLNSVSYLLDLKADCMIENDKNSTALHWAVRYEHVDVVRLLLTKGKADPNKERLQGLVAPIVLAAALGNVKIIEYLLANGANPNHVIRSGDTPLLIAAKEGHAPVIAVLLQHKAGVNCKDDNGNTPLINATANDHLKCIDLLMKAGAEATLKNHMSHDAWYFALQSENEDVLKIICTHSKNTKIPHLMAAKLGKDEKIEVLRKTGINIKEVDEDKNSLIHYAACFDQHHVISSFHSLVDMDETNKKGNTALHIACIKGHTNSIEALIEAKAKADIKNNDGRIALHVSATSKNTTPEIAQMLVEYTIKSHAWECLNCTDNNDDNALHLAAENAVPDVLWEFRSVRFKDVDHKGNTPLHDAVRPCHPEVLETMLDIFESMSRDADINTPNRRSETVLHLVATEGFSESLKRIIFLGGDLAAKDMNGNTLLHRLVLESTGCSSSDEPRHSNIVEVILKSVVRWWCMRNNYQIPNPMDAMYLKYKRDAIIFLIYDTKNNRNLSVMALACDNAAFDILSELMQIPDVTSFRMDNSTLYDVTFFTPKTSFSLKRRVCGQRVDPSPSQYELDSPSKVTTSNAKSKAYLQMLVDNTDKERGARLLNIPPLKKMEEMFKTVCMVTYLVMMIMHMIYMSIFSYASVTLLDKLRNNSDLSASDPHFILVYIWVPLEPAVFIIYFLVSLGGMIKRRDDLGSLSWRFISLFLGFSLLTISWLILVGKKIKENDYVLAIALCLGWLLTIAFTSGIKGIHYFWRMLRNMIIKDIFRFLVFYAIVWLAFSFAFHAVFQISQIIVNVYKTPGDTMFMVFNMMIGMAELFDDVYEEGMASVDRTIAYSQVLYMFYIVFSTIILLNLLIAMMNDSYSSILAHEKVIWRIDSVDIGINIEKTLPWITNPFKWLHKQTLTSDIGERWYVQVIDGELSKIEKKQELSVAEYVKIELDRKIKNIDRRIAGIEQNLQDTNNKLEETTNKLDVIMEYISHKKDKKEKKRARQASK